MPRPTLKQKLLRQPTRTYADQLVPEAEREPYWLANSRRVRESRQSIVYDGVGRPSLEDRRSSSPAVSSGAGSSSTATGPRRSSVDKGKGKAREDGPLLLHNYGHDGNRAHTANTNSGNGGNSVQRYRSSSPEDVIRHLPIHNTAIEHPLPSIPPIITAAAITTTSSATSSSYPSSSSHQPHRVSWVSQHLLEYSSSEEEEEEEYEDQHENENAEEDMHSDDSTVYFTPLASPTVGELPDLLSRSSTSSASSSSTLSIPDDVTKAPSLVVVTPIPQPGVLTSSIAATTATNTTAVPTSQQQSHAYPTSKSHNDEDNEDDDEEEEEDDGEVFSWTSPSRTRSETSLITAFTSPSPSSTSLPALAYTRDKEEIESRLVLPSQYLASRELASQNSTSSDVSQRRPTTARVASSPAPSVPSSRISSVSFAPSPPPVHAAPPRSNSSPSLPLTAPTHPHPQYPSSRPHPPHTRSSSLSSIHTSHSTSSSTSSLADMRMLDPALLAGPASTIGIPMANPTTGLPMLGSILDISRQSIASPPSLSPASSQVHLPIPDNSAIGSGMGGGRRRRPGLNNGSSTSVGRKMSFILEEAEDGDDVDSVSGSGSASGGSAPGSTIGVGTSESTPVRHSIALSAASARRSRTFSEGALVPPGAGIARMASSSSSYRRSSAASVISRASSTTSSSYHDRPPLNKYQRSSRTVDLPAYLAPSSRSGSPSPYSSHRRGSSLDLDHQSSLSSSYGSPLLLARATYAPSTNPNRVSSAIELSLPSASGAGRVATSMGSVEIVWGVGSSAGGGSNLLAVGGKKGLGGLLGGKNSSAISLPSSRRSSFIGNFSNSNSSSPTPAHIWHRTRAQTSPLGYSLRRPPPTRLKPAEVLVQVFAVGLDALDALVVRDKAGWLSSATFSGGSGEGAGWVPGRSFVGRAVEVGFEVRNCVRGDWVFGLLDLSKSGALAEFIVVDRRRVCRAPPPSSTLPPTSITHSFLPPLSLEQLALLPLLGVPAYRALRTLPGLVLQPPSGESNPNMGKTALVLNGHAGVGAMLVQTLAAVGVRVWAQVPKRWVVAGEGQARSEEDDDEEYSDDHHSYGFHTPAERAAALGATHTLPSPPLPAIASLPSSLQFDYVLDTVGGRRIWDAAQWVLKERGGQFTTLVGDGGCWDGALDAKYARRSQNPTTTEEAEDEEEEGNYYENGVGVPYEGSSLKSSMRSIKSAIGIGRSPSTSSTSPTKKSMPRRAKPKGLGYEWVPPNAELDTEGQDVRDTLEGVGRLATEEADGVAMMRPWWFDAAAAASGGDESARVRALDDVPAAFVATKGLFIQGGVVVARIVS